MKDEKYYIGESINKEHIYLDDEEADERLIDVQFMEKFTNKQKAELLQLLAIYIEKLEAK
jgi:hypothetical protein